MKNSEKYYMILEKLHYQNTLNVKQKKVISTVTKQYSLKTKEL